MLKLTNTAPDLLVLEDPHAVKPRHILLQLQQLLNAGYPYKTAATNDTTQKTKTIKPCRPEA
jgi:hypothetical protein